MLREIFAMNSRGLRARARAASESGLADKPLPDKETTMKTFRILCALSLLGAAPVFAGNEFEPCSTRMLAGRWMFATDIGHQAIALLKVPGDITAIGIFRIDRQGTILDGVFDATAQNNGFLQGVTFTGSVVVNPNCTGTLTFVTSAGTTRTDSIIVLGSGHARGMSQDVKNLWTYDMRRM
jgi:hypothetical protein